MSSEFYCQFCGNPCRARNTYCSCSCAAKARVKAQHSYVLVGEEKRCSKCQQYKPLSEFHKHKGQPQGVHARCKECINKAGRKYQNREDWFWKSYAKRTVTEDGCLKWVGRYIKGTPVVIWKGKTTTVRRLVYQLSVGNIPDDMVITTTCGNSWCVKISHLKLITEEDKRIHLNNLTSDRMISEQNPSRLHPERVARGDRHGSKTHPERVARGERNGLRLHPERVARGERSGSAKLTADDVKQIRALYAVGGISQTALARQFGVKQTTIWNIIRRERWKHVEDDVPDKPPFTDILQTKERG